MLNLQNYQRNCLMSKYPILLRGTRVKQPKGSDTLNGTIMEYHIDFEWNTGYGTKKDNVYIIQWDELKHHPDCGLREWPEKYVFEELEITSRVSPLPEELFNV